MKKWEHAFSCQRENGILGRVCPETPDCPCWVELVMTNIESGDVKIEKGCVFQMLPMLMVEVIKASNRPAAAIESTRNEIVGGFAALAGSFKEAIEMEKANRLTGGI